MAIGKLDEFHDRAVANSAINSSEASPFQMGRLRGNSSAPGLTLEGMSAALIPGEALDSAQVIGHTHEVPSPLNEVPSTTDKLSTLTRMRPGQQLLIRTPSGVIRSVTKPASPGPLTPMRQ